MTVAAVVLAGILVGTIVAGVVLLRLLAWIDAVAQDLERDR